MSEEDTENWNAKFSKLTIGAPQLKMEELLRALVASQQAQAQENMALVEEQKRANHLKTEELQLQRQMAVRNVRHWARLY